MPMTVVFGDSRENLAVLEARLVISNGWAGGCMKKFVDTKLNDALPLCTNWKGILTEKFKQTKH